VKKEDKIHMIKPSEPYVTFCGKHVASCTVTLREPKVTCNICRREMEQLEYPHNSAVKSKLTPLQKRAYEFSNNLESTLDALDYMDLTTAETTIKNLNELSTMFKQFADFLSTLTLQEWEELRKINAV
jgi:hypothetical protein